MSTESALFTEKLRKMASFIKHKLKQILEPVESSFKRTSIWKAMRPRRIHVYGVGAPRTGTLSLARLFKPKYRVEHEPYYPELIPMLYKRHVKKINFENCEKRVEKIDNKKRLEVNVSHVMVYILEELKEIFENAKFIVTIRHPKQWLNSMLDRLVKVRPKKFKYNHPGKVWKKWRKLSLNIDISEKEYGEKSGLYRPKKYVKNYLQYWSWHYNKVIQTLPCRRTLFILTKEINESQERISNFLKIDEKNLKNKSHSHKTKESYNHTEKINSRYLKEMIKKECDKTIKKLGNYSSTKQQNNYENK